MPSNTPSRRPAIPNYLPIDLSGASPGHRFSLYFAGWDPSWKIVKPYDDAMRETLPFQPQMELAASLTRRQQSMSASLRAEDILTVRSRSVSPFSTGLGTEHPVENGFAFLTPYGIPYLAGGGVKGVLRCAAQDKAGTDPGEVDRLFGPEVPENQVDPDFKLLRGALTFWDVFPTPSTETSEPKLSIEVMTPHHTSYLEGKDGPNDSGSPNDSESPNPILFLAVPPGWDFQFIVTCQRQRLPQEWAGQWKQKVEECFSYAFNVLGFGAKTSVGFGAFRRLTDAEILQQNKETAKAATRCPWVDAEMVKLKSPQVADPLVTKNLAEAWSGIEDAKLRQQALDYIRMLLGGSFDKASKKARAIYEKES